MMILILDSIKMFNISDNLMIEMFISVHFRNKLIDKFYGNILKSRKFCKNWI